MGSTERSNFFCPLGTLYASSNIGTLIFLWKAALPQFWSLWHDWTYPPVSKACPITMFQLLSQSIWLRDIAQESPEKPWNPACAIGKGHDLLSGYLNLAWCKPRMQGPWWRKSLPEKRPTGRGRRSAEDPIGGHDLAIIYLHVIRLHFKEAVSSLFMLNDFPFGLLISLFIQKIFSKYLAYVQGTIVSAGNIAVSKTKSCPCEIDNTHTYQWTNRVPKMKTQTEKPGR